jgi:hypothetical protein
MQDWARTMPNPKQRYATQTFRRFPVCVRVGAYVGVYFGDCVRACACLCVWCVCVVACVCVCVCVAAPP